MKCPRDASQMQFQGYWKHPRHVCRSCSGQLLSERDVMEALGHAEHSTLSTVARIQLAKLPESAIVCPRDEKTMRLIIYEGIEIDICPACRALWLDPGEYDKIRALRKSTSDAGVDLDLDAPGDGLDFDFVLDFVGDAVGSVFDGLL